MKWFFPAGFLLIISILLPISLLAQPSEGGQPLSQTPAFQRQYGDLPLNAQPLPPLNMEEIQKEDQARGGVPRFSAPVEVSYNLENSGSWIELEDGSRLWRLKLYGRGALAIAAFYEDFHLPPGARLFMYSEGYEQVLGAYTFRNQPGTGRFMTGFIRGETAIIEYYEPQSVRGQGRFRIFRADQAYSQDKDEEQKDASPVTALSFGFGTSFNCHQNANCPEGADWEAQKRSTCRIVMVLEEGTGYCSGTLINNTAEDETPYVLSAFHCQEGYTPLYDLWRFDFSYESSTCANPGTEPVPHSVLGCSRRAGRQENDFLLLEAASTIPGDFDVPFSGWNRQAAVPASGAILHHPSGDIKKVALFSQPALIHPYSIPWNNESTTPPNHHFRVTYSLGTFEPGSSGSGLFDPDGRVVGQLHGGFNDASCNFTNAYFGRLALAWEGGGTPETRLRDWLDPLGLGVDTLGIKEPVSQTASISGRVANESGVSIGGVQLILSGLPIPDTVTTGADGLYHFDDVPVGAPVAIGLNKADDFQNGLSTFDLVFISKHILGLQPLGSPYKIMASDVNGTNSLTTLDQISIRKVILGIDLAFSGKPAWQFFPVGFQFTDPADPFIDTVSNVWSLSNFSNDISGLDFIGIKSGDIDDSAGTGGN